jgi:hypothetical protein
MHFLKKLCFPLFIIFTVLYSNGQSIEFQNVMQYKSSNAGLIYSNNVLTGYYHLTNSKDEKSSVVKYKVDCLDLNLNVVGNFEFEKNNKS